MKCRRCKAPAVIDIRRHNAAFCSRLLPAPLPGAGPQGDRRVRHVRAGGAGARRGLRRQGLARALGPARRRSATRPTALYLGLGIGELLRRVRSVRARVRAEHAASSCTRSTSATDHGFDIPGAAQATRRAPCGACGLSKRHLFNSTALEHGYDVVATGHNLDDEAAVLLGNVLRWETGYLGRQYPVLPAGDGFARKVKPLVRLGEREMAAYCVLRGIDYQVEECPMAAGNRHLGFKEVLNALEDRSPGVEGRVPLRLLRAAATSASQTEERRASSWRRAPGAAPRPPPAGCARSARCGRARPAAHPSRSSARSSSGPAGSGDAPTRSRPATGCCSSTRSSVAT